MVQITTSLSPTKAIAIDEANSTTTYIGMGKVGSATSAAVWQIRRITKSGTVTVFEFADSNDLYDNIWDNRASLSYG